MKTTQVFRLLCIGILFVAFSSCSNSDDDDNNSSGDEFMTAKIDGTNWSASDQYNTVGGTLQTNAGITVLAVQGSDENGKAVNFSIINYNGPNTYSTGDNMSNSNLIQYITVSPVAGWSSNAVTSAVGGLTPGSITISSDADGVVEGTFSFEGYNGDDMTTKMVTEGSFKAIMD